MEIEELRDQVKECDFDRQVFLLLKDAKGEERYFEFFLDRDAETNHYVLTRGDEVSKPEKFTEEGPACPYNPIAAVNNLIETRVGIFSTLVPAMASPAAIIHQNGQMRLHPYRWRAYLDGVELPPDYEFTPGMVVEFFQRMAEKGTMING